MKEFNYTINGAPYRVVVNKSDSDIVELEVNGTPYTVELAQKKKSTCWGTTSYKCNYPHTSEYNHSSGHQTCWIDWQELYSISITRCNLGYSLQGG